MRNSVASFAAATYRSRAARFLLCACAMHAASRAQGPTAEDLEHFERAVRPLLAERCAECHGGAKPKAGLRVDHIEHLLQGGDNGPALVPGKPDESRMMRAVLYADVALQMPPRGKLSDGDIETLRDWIARGAPWPKEPVPEVRTAKETTFDLAARRAAHWCWRELSDPPLPEVTESGWARDALDFYVQAAREAQGLGHSGEVDARTWLRRASFDLLGLPPDPEELLQLGEHPTEAERAAAVDRLLASPRFGERWARHWLDLVRYAETFGHEYDYPIPEAWRYRDYAIRAFNADLPYDQLVREHIAGDLLPNPRRSEEGTDESILATAFWFFPQATHGPVDVRADEADRIDNQIDVFSKTFLGLTVACARCHDHKFDAISAQDYYALAGVLRSTRRQYAYLDAEDRLYAASLALEIRVQRASGVLQAGLADASLPPLAREIEALFSIAPLLPPPDRDLELDELERSGEVRGRIEPQAMRGFGTQWSQDRQLFWTGGKVGDRLEIRFRVERASRYELALCATRAHDYGIVKVGVDGSEALPALDLYAANVEPTGEVALGERDLAEGEHHLSIEITGSNPASEKRRFVGLDRLVLRRAGGGAPAEARALRARVAAERGLDAERLERWAAALGSEAAKEKGSALELVSALAAIETPEARAQRWQGARREAEEAVQAQRNALARSEPIADFDRDFEGWFETGQAFGGRPTRSGEWDARAGALGLARGGCADSGRLAPKLQGALRSPTFEITKPRLHWKLAGTGGQVRLIIDSYVMDTYNALIFGDISFDVDTRGRTVWRNQVGDVSRFLGHRAHLEILDDGDGWIAVDAVRAGDADLPEAPAESTRAWLASDGDAAVAFEARVARALQACSEGALDEEARQWFALLLTHDLLELPASACAALAAAHVEGEQMQSTLAAPIRALAAADGTGEDEYVFVRGSWRNKGPMVPRRFLEALGGAAAGRIENGSGRLQLADAVLAPENPLPARVMVNRAWHHLFGRGLVPSTDDFGFLGERPTHPELLDHLAHWFRNDAHWSLKALLKKLVLSSTYRLSSTPVDARTAEADPDAVWLHRARVRRLQGESLRDAMLFVSGRLDPTMYGPPIALHLTPFLEGRGRPGESGPVDGAGRRTIYQAVRRNFLPPFQMAFDMPVPHTTAGRRTVSNVPAQALALMNDPFVRELAEKWAERLLASDAESDASSDRARIERMYVAAFARVPSATELEAALAFLSEQRQTASGPAPERGAWADLAHVLFQVKAFQFLD